LYKTDFHDTVPNKYNKYNNNMYKCILQLLTDYLPLHEISDKEFEEKRGSQPLPPLKLRLKRPKLRRRRRGAASPCRHACRVASRVQGPELGEAGCLLGRLAARPARPRGLLPASAAWPPG
jgi:hypothetical protein